MTNKGSQWAQIEDPFAQSPAQPPVVQSQDAVQASQQRTAPGSVDLSEMPVEELVKAAKGEGYHAIGRFAPVEELARRAMKAEKIDGHGLLKKGQRVHVDVPEGSQGEATVMHDWDHSMFYVRMHLDGRPEGQIVSVCRKYVQLIAQEK